MEDSDCSAIGVEILILWMIAFGRFTHWSYGLNSGSAFPCKETPARLSLLADVAQFHEHRPPRPVPPEKLCGLVLVVVEEDIPDPGFRLSR